MTVPDRSDTNTPPAKKPDDASFGEVIEFVKTYAKQETLGPLKGAGSWLAFGAAAAFAMGLGLMLVLLGLLRLLQAEWEWSASGSFSWMAYLVALGATVILLGLTLSRIKKTYLNKEPQTGSSK